MIALLLVLLATAAPAQAPAVQLETALRTVVYKVSIGQRNETHIRHHNGVQLATTTFTDDGIVDVDVMAKTETLLGLRVTETLRSRGYPAVFSGNVGPDDGVHFPGGSVAEVTYLLLRFFGVRFAADQSLAVGSNWTAPSGIQYTVKTAAGPRVTLDVLSHLQVADSISTVVIHGTVVYDPGLLVPISGDLMQQRTQLRGDYDVETYEDLHFVRQSDSFDRPAAQ